MRFKSTSEETNIYIRFNDVPELKEERNISLAEIFFKNLEEAGLNPSWRKSNWRDIKPWGATCIYIAKTSDMEEIFSHLPEITAEYTLKNPKIWRYVDLDNLDRFCKISTATYSTDKKFGAFEIGYIDISGGLTTSYFDCHHECRKLTNNLLEKILENIVLERGILISDAFNASEVKIIRSSIGALVNENPDIWEMVMGNLRQFFQETLDEIVGDYPKNDYETRYIANLVSKLVTLDLKIDAVLEKSAEHEKIFKSHDCRMINILNDCPKEKIFELLMKYSPYFNGYIPYGDWQKIFDEMYSAEHSAKIKPLSDDEIIKALKSIGNHDEITTIHKAILFIGASRLESLLELADENEIEINFESEYLQGALISSPVYDADEISEAIDAIKNFSFSSRFNDAPITSTQFFKLADVIIESLKFVANSIPKNIFDKPFNESDEYYDEPDEYYDEPDEYYKDGFIGDDGKHYPDWLGGAESEEDFWEHE